MAGQHSHDGFGSFHAGTKQTPSIDDLPLCYAIHTCIDSSWRVGRGKEDPCTLRPSPLSLSVGAEQLLRPSLVQHRPWHRMRAERRGRGVAALASRVRFTVLNTAVKRERLHASSKLGSTDALT